MARPRVTFVIDDLGHGGAQRQLHSMLRALAGHGDFSVVVLSEISQPYAARIRALDIPVEVVPRRGGFEAGRVLALARALGRLDAHIVHAMLESSDAYAFAAARMRRIPAVLSLRSDRLQTTGARTPLLAWMLRRAAAVTVNSEAGRDHLISRTGVRADRVCLVPNIVDVPSRAPGRSDVAGVIGAVGRMVEMKRFDVIVNALGFVRRVVPGARVVLVGDGPARADIQALAERTGLADAVEFTGAVDDATRHIATFSCLVVVSTHEGLPNAALEALAHGVPVVAVAAGDLPRIVIDGVTGVIVHDVASQSISEAIVRALTSNTLRETAGIEGPRLMRERYSPDRAREQLLGLYARLVR